MESDAVTSAAPGAGGVALVPVRLDDGTDIFVEVRNPGGAEQNVSRGDLKFKGVENSIKSIAERVTAALVTVKPDKATVEFGVDVAVESGALTGLLAKGTGGATLKVTLEWGPPDA